MAPKKNLNSASKFINRKIRKSKRLILSKTLLKLVTTSSQPGLILSIRDFLDWRCQKILNKPKLISSKKLISQPLLTGELREPWTRSRTKDSVVHAGLSQLLPLLKVIILSKLVNSSIFQSNSLSIAIMCHMDAVVVLSTMLSYICHKSLKNLRLIMSIKVWSKLVKILNIKVMFQSKTMHKFNLTQSLNSRLLLPLDPFL